MNTSRPRFQFALRLLIIGTVMAFGLSVVGFFVWPWIAMDRTYKKRLEVGRQIVSAIYAFKHESGHWPTTLDELVPDYLPATQLSERRWTYRLGSGAEPPRLSALAGFHRYATYYFPPATHYYFPPGADHGWILNNEGTESFLGAN